MPVWLQHIETIVPETFYSQEQASIKMQEWQEDARTKRYIRAIYRKSGIEKRHSVIQNYDGQGADSFFMRGSTGKLIEPGTKRRNDIYARESMKLSVELARRTIKECPGIEPGEITHVITASCTGFYAPGPDFHIVRALSLPPSTQRYHLGFMGCYAALPALRMAEQFCRADPTATILVMALELCTLHLHLDPKEDTLMANSLFADGGGAAIVSSREPEGKGPRFRIEGFTSSLIPDGENDMAWEIGDRGFDMTLSSYVPRIIGENIRNIVEPVLNMQGTHLDDVSTWALHPGGKAIIDRVEASMGIQKEMIAPSREVLRRYGNMSSATIFFVLKEILRRRTGSPCEEVCAITFGPGLTVEMALLQAQGNMVGGGIHI